ncbi:MAG: competence protein CoiA family protein [Xenococcus sp. MO_188.B8]|nr:competence protein CoiA family protein [Xenococcus sp. MO_188.B8]
MWLEYALDKDNNPVSIKDVKRGRTNLRCPYCGRELIVKKGQIKKHHFSHVNEICNAISRKALVGLPLYDSFDLGLSPKYLEFLNEAWEQGKYQKYPNNPRIPLFLPVDVEPLEEIGVFRWNDWRRMSEFTKLGKIVVGGLSLNLFNQEQELRLKSRLEFLEEQIIKSKSESASEDLSYAITDYRLYREQYRKILRASLYFFEIKADNGISHKIGVTFGDIEQSISEIKLDLNQHFDTVSIKGLGFWSNRGNIEYYFQHRYQAFNYSLGNNASYFKFDDVKPVLRDLRRMKPKQLCEREREILEDKALDKVLLSLYIRHGMQKSEAHIGRPLAQRESTEKFLAKPKNQVVIAVLKKGLSLRQTASEAGVSVNTVRKVKAALEQNRDP